MLPKILKDMILSIDGHGYAGRINVTQMPKLARKLEEYQAGGMQGPVEIDLGSEKLEMEFESFEIDDTSLKLFGATGASAIGFRINGSIERDDDACTTQAIEMLARGRFREIDYGGFKPGDQHMTKYAVALTRISISIDAEEMLEIDNANNIFRVDGKDLLKKRRRALKM